MKKWFKYVEIAGVALLVMLAVSMFTLAAEDAKPQDAVSRELVKLKATLSLDETQVKEVSRILKASISQATLDRENFKLNGVALIEASRRRRKTKMQQIKMLMKPEQMKAFDKNMRVKPFDHELSMWIEGLLLNGDQAFTVEGILIEHYNRLETMMPEAMDQDDRMDRGGRGSGMGHGGGKSGGRSGMGYGIGMGRRGKSMMKELQHKKNKQIRKILDKNQKVLYKQILKDIKKTIKEQKEKFKNRKNRR